MNPFSYHETPGGLIFQQTSKADEDYMYFYSWNSHGWGYGDSVFIGSAKIAPNMDIPMSTEVFVMHQKYKRDGDVVLKESGEYVLLKMPLFD